MKSTHRPLQSYVAGAAVLALVAGAAVGSCPTPHSLGIATPGYHDGMGSAIDWDGGSLMVGVPGRNVAGTNAGAAYLFTPSGFTWVQGTQILASDAAAGDNFGAAVAHHGSYAAIGAPGRGTSGSVYFFERSGSSWNQMTRVNVTSQAGADVGRVLAMSGTTVAVGVPKKTLGPVNEFADAGSVYLYQRNSNGTWGYVQQIREDWTLEPVAGDRFGEAVALHGDLMVVGVPQGEYTQEYANHGYIRVYRRVDGTFVHEAQLNMAPLIANARFGTSVATDGSYIAVGAPWRNRASTEGGSLAVAGGVYVYRYQDGQWWLDATILASDASAYGTFGTSVGLRDGRLVVGAAESKKAYVFRRLPNGTWHEEMIIRDPRTANGTQFASTVAFNGQQIAVGDPAEVAFQASGGITHVYNRPNFSHSDDCVAAVPVSQGTFTGCSDSATRDGSAACGGTAGSQGPDVWFSWTSGCAGTLHLDTIGSSFDTLLSVHTGCPGTPGAQQVVCNNDAPGHGTASRVQFNYQPGVTYYIRLSGMNGASGTYTLNVTDGNGNPPANNSCSGAQVVTDGTYSFATCRAGGGFPSVSGCTPQGSISFQHDVWFRYTAPSTGTGTVDLCGSGYSPVVAVYNRTSCPGIIDQPMTCSMDGCPDGKARVQFAMTQGQQYLIRVGSYNAPGGMAQMVISSGSSCPADWNDDGLVNSGDITAFLTSWLGSIQSGTQDADFNGDGLVNSGDITAFLTAWLSAVSNGC